MYCKNKKKTKPPCSTLEDRITDFNECLEKENTECLTPKQICKCLKLKKPEPQLCFNIYPPKKKRGKKRSNNNTNSNIDGQGSQEFESTGQIPGSSNVSESSKRRGKNKNYSGNNAAGSDTESDTTYNSRNRNKYGYSNNYRKKTNNWLCPPRPICLDTTPNYYAKVDAQKTDYEFYARFPNCQIWRPHLPRPPILIGVNKCHLHCFANKGDYLDKYLKQKKKLASRGCED